MTAQNVFEPIYNKAIDALGRGDMDTYVSVFAPEFVLHNISGRKNETLEQHRQGLQEVLARFPGTHMIVEEAVCQGTPEKGAFVLRFRFVTGTGNGIWMGIPVDGKKLDFYVFWELHVLNGKCVEGWQLDDGMAAFTQLGVIPSMPGA